MFGVGKKEKSSRKQWGHLQGCSFLLVSSDKDLYDDITMPPELRKAHQEIDRVVMQVYGMSVKNTTESSCVVELVQLYQKKQAISVKSTYGGDGLKPPQSRLSESDAISSPSAGLFCNFLTIYHENDSFRNADISDNLLYY